MEYVWPICLGICLAACAGLRAFVPLLAVGLLFRLGYLEPNENATWLGSTPALVAFSVATVVEVLADKFPAVDHALDVVQSFVRPTAGVIVVTAVLTDVDPVAAVTVGLIVGLPTTGAVHAAKASGRLLSSVATGGTANPVISVIEDVGVLLLLALALLVLPVAIVLVALLLVGCVKVTVVAYRSFRHRVPALWRQTKRRAAWQWGRLVCGRREPRPQFCGECLIESPVGAAVCPACRAE